jgi:transcriptional regulator with XRE-family HTH domain
MAKLPKQRSPSKSRTLKPQPAKPARARQASHKWTTDKLPERVLERRKALGLTLRDASVKSELHHSKLSRIERNVSSTAKKPSGGGLSVVTLVRLAIVYETSTDYLCGLTDDPRPATPAGGGTLSVAAARALAASKS